MRTSVEDCYKVCRWPNNCYTGERGDSCVCGIRGDYTDQ